MIVKVNDGSLMSAAKIHSESWKESHKSFCSADFVEQHTAEHQENYLRGEIKAGKKVYMLVENRPVGIVSVHENLIENLYILPDEQNKGYGTKLLLFAMRHCPEAPTLWILENNYRAYSLYSKYGFRETGKQHKLSQNLSEIEMKCSGSREGRRADSL
ncbi:MAG: GNAT family N-acetyltransferase [Oscillospiraceae bacterium]|nr:GNAT family N-acetyltransferase [Oscillospiraceae bacterium]